MGLAMILSGCSFYHAKPLTKEEMQQKLAGPDWTIIAVQAKDLHHPLLAPLEFDYRDGLSPDEAAVVAVLANPALITTRNQRGLAQAQVIEAGILPNPELSFGMDFPKQPSPHVHPLKDIGNTVASTLGDTLGSNVANAIAPGVVPVGGGGGTTAGGGGPTAEKLVNAYSLGVQWEITSLIPLLSKLKGAKANAVSVNLNIAWQEWQTAESAKLHVFHLVSLEDQLALTREMENDLAENFRAVQKAVELGGKTIVEQAAAETALLEAHLTVLGLKQETEKERLELNKTLGVPPAVQIPLQKGITLPVWVNLPSLDQMMDGIEDRRLDLVAMKYGYQSQEEKLRTAVLEQFPRIGLGVTRGRDTSNIVTMGFASTFGLPIFDRNQAAIATERATRQQLFDEYILRLFDARAEIAGILVDIQAVKEQIQSNQQAVKAQTDLVQVYHQILQQGNADVLSYYNTRIELIKKRLEVLKLQMELVDQSISLELAAGEYFQHTQAERNSK